jgi:hypothetical protein
MATDFVTIGGDEMKGWLRTEADLVTEEALTKLAALADAEQQKWAATEPEETAEEGEDDSCSEEYELPQSTTQMKLRGMQQCHEINVDRYDDEYHEDADPRNARKWQDKAMDDTDRWMRYDFVQGFAAPPEGAGSIIPVGANGDFAALLAVKPGTEMYSQRDPELVQEAAAEQYVRSVQEDIKVCEDLDEVEACDRAFCMRADMDPKVMAKTARVRRSLDKARTRMLEKVEQAKKEREAGEVPEGKRVLIEAKKELQRLGLPEENPMVRNPELTSFIRPRPMDELQWVDVSVNHGDKKRAVVYMPAELLEQQQTQTSKLNKKQRARERKEQIQRNKEIGAECLAVANLLQLLEAAADTNGSTDGVPLKALRFGLLVASAYEGTHTKRQAKLVKHALSLYREITGKTDNDPSADGYRPLEELVSAKEPSDIDAAMLKIPVDELRVAVYRKRMACMRDHGNMDKSFSDEERGRLRNAEVLLEFCEPPATRDLEKLLKLAREFPQLPLMREMQRSVVATEKIIGLVELKAEEIDPKHRKLIKKARKTINLRAGVEGYRDVSKIMLDHRSDEETPKPTARELDAAIAVARMRQWDGADGFGAMEDIMNADMLEARLVVDATYREKEEMERRLEEEELNGDKCFDFRAYMYFSRTKDARKTPMSWNLAARAPTCMTTGACSLSPDSPQIAVGRTRGFSVHALPTGTKTLDVTFHKSWGGRVRQITMNSQFVCVLFDYPRGLARRSTFQGLIYHIKSGKARLVDMGAVSITSMLPDPERPSVWIGSETGYIFCFSWEKATFDTDVQYLMILSSVAPVLKMHRIGRRMYAMTPSDGYQFDVIPLRGETMQQMTARAGRPHRFKLGFPSDIGRWGPIVVAVQRDYKTRMICGGMTRVLPGTVEHRMEVEKGKMVAFQMEQYIHFARDTIVVLYADGTLRALWPGTTATQYESKEAQEQRSELQSLMAESFSVGGQAKKE